MPIKLLKANVCALFCVLTTASLFMSRNADAQVILSRSFSVDGAELEDGGFSLPIGPIISSAMSGDAGPIFSSAGQLPNDTAALLRMPQIVNELGLDPDQVEAASALSRAMGKQITEVIKSIDFGADSGKVMQEAQRTIRTKTKEKLEELLTPNQLERLSQIKTQSALKSRGALALLTGALNDAIRLTDKQKNLLRTVNAAKQKELRAEIEKLEKQYFDETIEEVLTSDQQRELKSMIGEAYEIKKRDYQAMIQQRINSRKQKADKKSVKE